MAAEDDQAAKVTWRVRHETGPGGLRVIVGSVLSAGVCVSVKQVLDDSRVRLAARYPRPLSTRLMTLSTPRSAASMTGRTGRWVPKPVAWPVQ